MNKFGIIFIFIIIVFVFAACGGAGSEESELNLVAYNPPADEGDTQPEDIIPTPEVVDPTPEVSTSSGNEIHEVIIDAYGKTYDELKAEFPDAYTDREGEEMHNVFFNAAFPYMSIPGFEFGFIFFGTQWGPPLTDVVTHFGNEITCIGATGNVRGVFPDVPQDMSNEDFFAYLGVDEYDHYNWGSPDYPEVGYTFEYMDFEVCIDAGSAPDSDLIKGGFPVIVYKGDLLLNDKYLKMTDDIIRGV